MKNLASRSTKLTTSPPKLNNPPPRLPLQDMKTIALVCASVLSTQLINNITNITPADVYQKTHDSIHTVASLELHKDPFAPNQLVEKVVGTGTGFSYIGREYVVTNAHVVNDSYSIKVDDLDAEIVDVDARHDVALLHVNLSRDTSRPLKKCDNPAYIGEQVLAIGNPYGFDKSLTTGVVSGKERKLDSDVHIPLVGLIQTDAAINPGNSGGPLLDAHNGCIVGMNTALVSSNGVNTGVGFAVPIDTIDEIVKDMIQEKKHEVVQFGVTLLPDVYAEGLGIKGLVVANVLPGTIASDIGLIGTHRDGTGRPVIGDIILEVDGVKVAKASDLYSILGMLRKGDEINIKVLSLDGEHIYNVVV